MSTLVKQEQVTNAVESPKVRSQFAYRVMLVFSFLYYFRPEDIIPGLSGVPLAKITGGIALLGLLLGTSKGRPKKLPVEVRLLFAQQPAHKCAVVPRLPCFSHRPSSSSCLP